MNVTCRSCANWVDEQLRNGRVWVTCAARKGDRPIMEMRDCREDSAAREPGVDEEFWESDIDR